MILASKRLLFFWNLDKADLFVRLTPHSATISTGFSTLSHPPSIQTAPAGSSAIAPHALTIVGIPAAMQSRIAPDVSPRVPPRSWIAMSAAAR